MIDATPLNVRIHDSKITAADTVTLTVFGITEAVIVQSTGTFAKGGSGYEFVPETISSSLRSFDRKRQATSWRIRRRTK